MEKINAFLDWLLGRCGACRKAKAKKMMMGKKACGTCFVGDTLAWTSAGPRHVSELDDGWLMETYLDGECGGPAATGSGRRRTRRSCALVELLLAKGDGNEVVIRMLASVEWVKRERVEVGRWVELNLAEMSAVGSAGVTAVEACPRLPRGPGKCVTKMFRHKAGVVLDLQLEGEERRSE